MAQPIPLQLPPRDPREELRKRLDQAPIAHAEALLDSYELLQQLRDHGIFELLRGAVQRLEVLLDGQNVALALLHGLDIQQSH